MIGNAAVLAIALVLVSVGLDGQTGGNPLASDRWSGRYQNAELRLELARKSGQYAGSLVFGGNTLPLTATVRDNVLEGSFAVGEQRFTFRAEGGGARLTLITDGTRYELQREGEGHATVPEPPAATQPPAAKGDTGIVGDWRSPQGIFRIAADGTAVIGGMNYRYSLQNGVISFNGPDGAFAFPYQLNGDTLIVTLKGQPTALTRITKQAGQAAGGVRQELAGKWCYVANFNATNGGGSSSSTCVVLNPDGTYQYSGQSSSSNPYGGAASQSSDSGTWTATEDTLSVVSRAYGPINYRMEKRNHPKNGDPMLVLDGKAFVTFYQKAPWR